MGCRIQDRRAVKYNVGVACLASRCLGDLFVSTPPLSSSLVPLVVDHPPSEKPLLIRLLDALKLSKRQDTVIRSCLTARSTLSQKDVRGFGRNHRHRSIGSLCPSAPLPPPPSRRWWRELLTQALHCGVEVDPEPIGGRCQCSWVQSESGGKGKGQTSSFHRLNSTRAILRASCRHFAPLRRRPTACQRQSGGPPVHIVPPPPPAPGFQHTPPSTDRPTEQFGEPGTETIRDGITWVDFRILCLPYQSSPREKEAHCCRRRRD